MTWRKRAFGLEKRIEISSEAPASIEPMVTEYRLPLAKDGRLEKDWDREIWKSL
jgi:hypothetical protein